MKFTTFTVVLLLTIVQSRSQQVSIIPEPMEMAIGKNFFTISPSTVIVVRNGVDDNTAAFFNDYLKKYFGFALKKVKSAKTNFIEFNTVQMLVAGKEGAYTLLGSQNNVSIHGQTASGTFCGMQSLIQLLPVLKTGSKLPIPVVSINDAPRFQYRGMHLDCGRHFFSVEFVKRYIDYLALHKLNTFHWHLTDDQGWRIEIKKYPRLTQVGGWRNGTIIGRYPGTGNDGKRYGGYYTQKEIKDVVQYAAQRFITVIPEIEMPGHSSAAIAAYPELSCFPAEPTINYFPKQCKWNGDTSGKQVQQTWGVFADVFCAGKENTFQFLQDVIDEVLPLFPSKIIHVGGDECPKENWKRCPLCQQRMKDNNLKSEHELQSYFIQRIEKYLNSKGRTLIGWDEILEGGLAPNALVMSWRGEEGGIEAARQNHGVIMTPGGWLYFDHAQSQNEDSVTIGGFVPLEKTYSYEPVPAGLDEQQAKNVLGAQANLWSEYISNPRKAEYMLFPRMSALSEVVWSAKGERNWNEFERRLLVQFKRYDLWKANYSKAYFDLRASVEPPTDRNGVDWRMKLKSHELTAIDFLNVMLSSKGDTSIISREKYLVRDSVDIPVRKSGTYLVRGGVSMTNGKKIDSRSAFRPVLQSFTFNKATGRKIALTTPPSDKYPGDGPFTLVNGVQNSKGLARSTEFLGFEGPDCEALIDLGSIQSISNVITHTLSSGGSWVYPPQSVEVSTSTDGQSYSVAGKAEKFETTNGSNGTITVSFGPINARYVKVYVKNFGVIPTGLSGAGNKAWLFVDEIEVN